MKRPYAWMATAKRAYCLAWACGLTLLGLIPPAAMADVSNKKTIMTTNVPVKIPSANVVLPAGTYVIKLLDSTSNRNIVQIFNDREDKLYATVLAIPNYRLQPSEKTQFTFWETPSGQPIALRSWFYPGDTSGVEFVYPRKMAARIARSTKQNVPTIYSESQKPEDLKKARVGVTTPEGKEAELPKETYEAPAAQK
jgi:hypothetical protein